MSLSTMSGRHLAVAGAAAAGLLALSRLAARLKKREDGKERPDEQALQRLRQVFAWCASGMGVTSITAVAAYRLFPRLGSTLGRYGWFGLTLATVAPLVGALLIPKRRREAKVLSFFTFHAVEGVALSTLGALGASILSPAVTATCALTAGLGAAAAVAPSTMYLTLATPLSCGLVGVVMTNFLASVTYSAGHSAALLDVRILLSLLVASGYIVYDSQRIVAKARQASDAEFDPIASATVLTVDVIDLFISVVRYLVRAKLEEEEEEKRKRRHLVE